MRGRRGEPRRTIFHLPLDIAPGQEPAVHLLPDHRPLSLFDGSVAAYGRHHHPGAQEPCAHTPIMCPRRSVPVSFGEERAVGVAVCQDERFEGVGGGPIPLMPLVGFAHGLSIDRQDTAMVHLLLESQSRMPRH